MTALASPFSFGSGVRRLAIFAVAFLAVLASAAPVKFEIPAQPAPEALQAFIKQSGAKVLFIYAEVKDVRTNAISGEYEAEAALATLLDGTGLCSEKTAEGKFTISKIPVSKPGSVDGSIIDEAGKPVAGARVSLADTNKIALTDKRGRFNIKEVAAGAHALNVNAEGMQNTRVTDVIVKAGQQHSLSPITIPVRKEGTLQLEDFVVSAKKNDGVFELDPYEVTGQKPKAFTTANIDITRTNEDVLPFNVFTAKEIEQSGAQDLADFFRNRLPQNFQTSIPEESLFNGMLNNPLFALGRLNLSGGLGQTGRDNASEMILLVDGRRLPNRYYGNQGETNVTTGDFRGIPIASIERVEYLSSAASAIYGAGATKGVINIVTKRDYRGGSISLGYETPMDTHAPNRSVDLYYATPLKWGVSLRLTYAYSDRDPLTLGDRANVTIEPGRRIIMQRQPTLITNELVLGATPNINSFGVGLFGPGSATITSVPDGYAGGQGITPFKTRQGVYNLNLADGGIGGGYGKNSRLGAVSNDTDISVGLEKSFGGNWRATVEYRRAKNVIRGSTEFEASFGSGFLVPASAPTNPFGVDVYVYAYDPRLERPELADESVLTTDQFTATLRGNISEWMTIFDASYIRDKDSYRNVDFSGPLGGGFDNFNPAIASGLYNPFVDMRTTAPAPASFYEEYEQQKTLYGGSTDNYQITAKTSGSLHALPAGDLQVTCGLEWLAQERGGNYHVNQYGVNSKTGGGGFTSISNPLVSQYKSVSSSAYSEVNLPLIGGKQRIPLVKRLELFVSGRISSQSLRGNDFVSKVRHTVTDATGGTIQSYEVVVRPREYKTTPYVYAAGLRYDIVEGLAFRVSKSIGFRPPAFLEIIPGKENTSNVKVIDRRADRQVILAPGMFISGGSTGLRPETTNSTNYGVIFEPARIRGLRLSVDYVESIRDDAIVGLSAQTALDLEASDPAIAARVQRNAAGAITYVDGRNMNFARIATKTANLTLVQRVDKVFGGQVLLTASAAKNISYKIQSSANTRPLEQVRVPTAGNIGRWNANAQASWEGKQWSFGWNTKYFDSVLVTPTWQVAQGGDRLEWALDHGAFVSYQSSRKASTNWHQWLFSELNITIGVKNIFNRAPRFEARSYYGGYVYQGDSVYGRSIWLNVKKNF